MTRADGRTLATVTDRFEDRPETVRAGVPSWTDETTAPTGVEPGFLETLLEYMRAETTRTALRLAIAEHDLAGTDAERVARDTLFVDPADAWRIPVSASIGGRCLDVNAGFGTRSLLLAELATTVDAVDDSPQALAFLDRRDDYAVSDRVTPMHADPLSPPQPDPLYDTIVADFSGPNRPASLRSAISALDAVLDPNGSMLLLVDGWPRLTGLTAVLGIGESTMDPHQRPTPVGGRLDAIIGAVGGYERLLDAAPDDFDQYGIVPDPSDPSFLLPVTDAAATERLVGVGRAADSITERLAARTATVMNETGLIARSWPSYLLVRHPPDSEHRRQWGLPSAVSAVESTQANAPAPNSKSADSPPVPSTPTTNGLLTRGGGRSTIMGTDTNDPAVLTHVTKVPHRRAHAEFVLDERRTMKTVRAASSLDTRPDGISLGLASPPVPETIPDGSVTMTRFGPTYTEAVAEGSPLSGFIARDPDRFQDVLELGFDWLARLHQRFGSRPARWSRDVVRDHLSCPDAGLEPPADVEALRLFTVPCHGDFHPKNVFVGPGDSDTGAAESGAGTDTSIGPVTAVIDWELGGPDAPPIVDAGFFALQTARLTFGSLEAGLDAAFTTPGPYADAVRDVVDRYCTAVDLSPDVFLTLLPAAWVWRVRRCERRGATASYSGRAVRRINDVHRIRDRRDEIADVLTSDAR